MSKKSNNNRSGTWLRRHRRQMQVFLPIYALILTGFGLLGWWSSRSGVLPPGSPAATWTMPSAQTPETLPTVAVSPAADSADTTTSPGLFFSASFARHERIFYADAGSGRTAMLVAGDWDDADPAVSPDGTLLAFASNRNGNWDLYAMQLADGSLQQLTQTSAAEANPTWDPASRRLAYEVWQMGAADLWLLNLSATPAAVALTSTPLLETDPDWDPTGERLAFVRSDGVSSEIVIADLQRNPPDLFSLSELGQHTASQPDFHPDGGMLVYAARQDGISMLTLVEVQQGGVVRRQLGLGSAPAWLADGSAISAVLDSPTDSYVVLYPASGLLTSGVMIPPGLQIRSLDWIEQPDFLRSAGFASFWKPLEFALEVLRSSTETIPGRTELFELEGIRPPGLLLSGASIANFQALRAELVERLGWDLLGELEYAFVGLNDPLPPGFEGQNWLYTGRAFAFSPAGLQAGQIELVREDLAAVTYWRVFLRAARQDGSVGKPLRSLPWDLEARLAADPLRFNQGGALKNVIPSGYYVDLTELAAAYGFSRVPALSNWRTFYPGARWNHLVFTDELTWEAAMLQLYPPGALASPTAYQTPTPTATPAPSATPVSIADQE